MTTVRPNYDRITPIYGHDMHNYSYKIVIHPWKIRKDKRCPIYLQVFINGTRIREALNIHVFKKEFDENKQRVKLRDKKLQNHYNAYIEKIESDTLQAFMHARIKNVPLKKRSFINHIKKETGEDYDFIEFMKSQIEKRKDLVAKSTIKQYRRSMKVIQEFNDSFKFSDIDYSFVVSFEKFLKRKKLATNSRWGIHKHFKVFINEAIKLKLFDEKQYPYNDFKVKKSRTSRTFLNLSELNKLQDFYHKKPSKALKAWLGMAYTSLRVQDILEIEFTNIRSNTLVFTPQKTSESLTNLEIPLSARAKILIGEGRGQIFDQISDVQINKQIKGIAKKCGIKKNVTCHVARHTFATLYLKAGGKIERLQKILGHKDIETTMVYTHITLDEQIEDVAKMDDLFDGLK